MASPENIWIVIPAYNEAPRIAQTLISLKQRYHSIVVVDDGSTDNTGAIARSFGVEVLTHVKNYGQGAALRTGIRHALAQGASLVVTFDADGQHSASDIPSLVSPILNEEADVVFGSRFLGTVVDIPLSRLLVLKMGVRFSQFWTGVKLTDAHNGLRALSRKAAERIRIRQPRMAHATEFAVETRAHRLRHREVPVTITYSRETLDKGQHNWESIPVLWDILLAGRTATFSD